jgi:hypothetical protein
MNDTTTMDKSDTDAGSRNPGHQHSVASQGGLAAQGKGPTDHIVRRGDSPRPPIRPMEQPGGQPPPQVSGGVQAVESPLMQMHALIARAGEELWSVNVVRIVTAPIDDAIVEILPNGTIDVPHVHWRDRLNAAFGVGGWVHVPLAAPRREGDEVAYYGFLKAQGRYIGDAVGGSQYIPNKRDMTYADCVESAKSRSLKRCCKQLGMFAELWDKSYQDYWKSLYAEQYRDPEYPKYPRWRRKKEFTRKFEPRAEPVGPDRPLVLTANDEYNDNAPYYDDGRED